jgi:TP901 family phage tail tape measure protein
MPLNNYGLGFQVTAEDSASAVFEKVGGKLGNMEKDGAAAAISLQEAAAQMTSMGAKFTAVSQGITTVLGAAVAEATRFGAAIGEVSTLIDQAVFPIERMRDISMSLANTYGEDATNQAKALYQTISAGVADAAAATKLLDNANKLAIGGVTDVTTAVDSLTNAVNTFSDSGLTAEQAADAMFIAIKAGKTNATELAGTLGRVGATASTLGISFEQMAGSVAAITTKGIATNEAVAGLKAALAGIIKPTGDAAKEAQRLGITFDAATLRAKGLPGFLDSITKSTKFNADTFGKLFGSVEALNSIQALTANGSKTFNDILDQMAKKGGAAQEAFEKMTRTSKFQATLLDGRLKNAYIAIGEAVQPVVDHVKGFISRGVELFNKLSPRMKQIVTWVGVAAAAFTGLIGGALGAAGAVAGLVLAGKALLIGLGLVAAVMGAVVLALVPLILLGTALYVAWTKNIGGFQDKVVGAFNKVKLVFQALSQVFSDGGFSGAVQKELGDAENSGIKAFAINAFLWFNRIKNFFSRLGAAFSAGMARVGPIIERISGLIQKLAARFGSSVDAADANQSALDKWGAIGAKVGDVLVTIVEKVALGIEKVLSFADGFLETFAGFTPALDAGKAAVGELFAAISQIFGSNDKTETSADTWRTVGQVLGWVANVGITVVATQFRMLAGVISWVSGLIGGVQTIFQGVINGVIIGVQLITAIFTGQWGKVWTLAGAMVDNWVSTVIDAFSKVVGGAAGMLDSIGKLFGKDLGLKKGVQDWATSLKPTTTAVAPGTSAAPAAGPPTAGGSPAVAQAQGTATASAAIAAAAQGAGNAKPVEVNNRTTLVVDGQVLADVVSKNQQQAAGRGFAPTPAPT